VLGRHGSWLGRAVDGQISSAVTTNAACAVVVVPLDWDAHGAAAGPILLYLDGTTAATDLLAFAFEEADRSGRTLTVFHAVDRQADQLAVEADRRDIAEITAGWHERFPDVIVIMATSSGDPGDAIITASTGVSMVVIGSSHRHVWSLHPRIRSIIDDLACPLIVVPQREVARTASAAVATPASA
jgi:nucleotide-binding universal stress UspA family protein